jgi:SpoVK/Ycf46/Vps4 family AAA+-type ATPase
MAEKQEMEFFTYNFYHILNRFFNLRGADLVALIHEAALIALKERIEHKNLSIKSVNSVHFEEALKKVTPSVKFEDRLYYKKLKEKLNKEKF